MECERDGERPDDVQAGGCAVADADEDRVENDARLESVRHDCRLRPRMLLVVIFWRLPPHAEPCQPLGDFPQRHMQSLVSPRVGSSA